MIWRRAIRSLVAVSVAAVLLAATVSDTLACSGGGIGQINQNDLIVEGWVENVEIEEPAPASSFKRNPTTLEAALREVFQPVHVTMRVARSWKGQTHARLVFTDPASYVIHSAAVGGVWDGSGGACGVFNDDPTGKYGFVVFRGFNEELSIPRVRATIFGDGPADPEVEQFRRYVEDNVHPAEQPRILPDPWAMNVDLQSGWQALAALVVLTAAGSALLLLVMRRLSPRQ